MCRNIDNFVYHLPVSSKNAYLISILNIVLPHDYRL